MISALKKYKEIFRAIETKAALCYHLFDCEKIVFVHNCHIADASSSNIIPHYRLIPLKNSSKSFAFGGKSVIIITNMVFISLRRS